MEQSDPFTGSFFWMNSLLGHQKNWDNSWKNKYGYQLGVSIITMPLMLIIY
jgi:hypothetical protein